MFIWFTKPLAQQPRGFREKQHCLRFGYSCLFLRLSGCKSISYFVYFLFTLSFLDFICAKCFEFLYLWGMKYSSAEKLAAFKKVLQAIERGASVRAATRSAGTINASTFHEWVAEDEEFAKQYARAAERRAEAIFEDIINIADENHKDVYVDSEGIERTDHDVVQRARLRVDARKWVLAKMQPRKYGDKLDLTSGDRPLLAPVIGMVIKNELPQAEEPQNLQDDEFGDLD